MTADYAGFRIVKTKWADSAFDGEGAKLHGGRWNSKGKGCIYLASSESLATLEMLVHLNSMQIMEAYTLFKVSIAVADVIQLDPKSLPVNWQADPAPSETALIGDEWLDSMQSAGLWVPSTIISREKNILLNPRHPSYESIVKGAQPLPFNFDNRLK